MPMKSSNHLLSVLAVFVPLLAACSSDAKGGKSSGSATASQKPADSKTTEPAKTAAPSAAQTGVVIGPPGSSGATIEYNPDGPNAIDPTKLKGDKATCDKVMACCNKQSGPLALGCQLAISSEGGDCAKILKTVQPMAKEMGKPPAGCE